MAKGRPNNGRSSGHRNTERTPYTGPNPWTPSQSTYFHRQVLDTSVGQLNRSTENIRGRSLTRMVDYFTSTLVYPREVRRFIDRSQAEDKATQIEIGQALAELTLPSLLAPIEVEVQEVRGYGRTRTYPHYSSVGVRVNHDGWQEECETVNDLVRDMLGYPDTYRGVNVTGGHMHISLIRGHLDDASGFHKIFAKLPDTIHLSEAKLPPKPYTGDGSEIAANYRL